MSTIGSERRPRPLAETSGGNAAPPPAATAAAARSAIPARSATPVDTSAAAAQADTLSRAATGSTPGPLAPAPGAAANAGKTAVGAAPAGGQDGDVGARASPPPAAASGAGPGPAPGAPGAGASAGPMDGFGGEVGARDSGKIAVPANPLLPDAGSEGGRASAQEVLSPEARRWLERAMAQSRSEAAERGEQDGRAMRADEAARQRDAAAPGEPTAGSELAAANSRAALARLGALGAAADLTGPTAPWEQQLATLLRGAGGALEPPLGEALGRALLASSLAAGASPDAAEPAATFNAVAVEHFSQLAEASVRQGGGWGGVPAGPGGRAGAAGDLGSAEQQRLALTVASQPPGGAAQPVLSLIAANIFRLQAARQEITSSLRVADESGELPPQDEDEARERRAQVQGIDLGGMFQFDRKPADRQWGEGEEEGGASGRGLLQDAILTAALQSPYRVLTMFHAAAARRGVRLFVPAKQGGWEAVWVHMPAADAGPPPGPGSAGPDALPQWLLAAEAAAEHLARSGRPAPEERLAAAAYALGQVTGRDPLRWPAGADDGARGAWALIRASSPPRSAPALLLTADQVGEPRLRPAACYGIIGGLLDGGRAMVLLCERQEAVEGGEPWRLLLLPLPVVVAAAQQILQAPPAAPPPRGQGLLPRA